MIEDETSPLVEATKAGLLDKLLDSIHDKFYSTSQTFIPPRELIPYLEGKEPETKEEAQDCRAVFNKWQEESLRVLKRQPTAENLQKFLKALPEPFRGDLIRALGKSIV